MSSPSLKTSGASEILIVGNLWTGPLFARAFRALGQNARCLVLVNPDPAAAPLPGDLAVHVGNGEYPENARLIFGPAVAGGLWALSACSYDRAKRLLTELKLPFEEHGLLRFGEKQDEERDQAFVLPLAPLTSALSREMTTSLVTRVQTVERLGSFDYQLRFREKGKASDTAARAEIIVIVSDYFPPALLPSFSDKWLQVTLGSFTFPSCAMRAFSLALFHRGADFAIASGTRLRVGSFRNLYLDKAVGIHPQPDPATLEGIRGFFGGMGWIEADAEFQPQVSVETLSCDGLPIVGALPDLPGVYLVTGFAGRAQNFLFEVAPLLASGIVGSSGFESLRLFNTKRFL